MIMGYSSPRLKRLTFRQRAALYAGIKKGLPACAARLMPVSEDNELLIDSLIATRTRPAQHQTDRNLLVHAAAKLARLEIRLLRRLHKLDAKVWRLQGNRMLLA